jgi:ATP-dependent Clp protease adaptor protein ClpS
MSDNTLLKNENKTKIEKPRKYKVVLLNDNYTTMEFVIEVLMMVFSKSFNEASKIMLDVHKKGKGIVGSYSYDIALTKVKEVESLAKANKFPLKAEVEEE